MGQEVHIQQQNNIMNSTIDFTGWGPITMVNTHVTTKQRAAANP